MASATLIPARAAPTPAVSNSAMVSAKSPVAAAVVDRERPCSSGPVSES
ncbi:hypothetical protein SAMN05660209_01057 [Geodermatophilus africanus]|uniref:Uncharacterized protein n=1 Tax=Geodermatophilus africanus TaxID=1137993 RepID=A0A1H3DMP0_9ACTN|nr:hypothetical protein SAMN05660209_01057 [Geodermatophilus africanus]